nr:diagnostic antigen gp50 [Hymenolepis microstoma]
MIVSVFVFVLLQINVPFGIEASDLSASKCSRIVAKPYGKSDPIIFVAHEDDEIYVTMNSGSGIIKLNGDKCYVEGKLVGEPCYRNSGYYNITINEVEQFEEILLTSSEGVCVLLFVPNCAFKTVKPGEVVPQVSFPFARFVKGNNSVIIHFSIKGHNYQSLSALKKNNETMCFWSGRIVKQKESEKQCRNLTENAAKDQLDYTLEYQRVSGESITNFEFLTEMSGVGVTVYWDEGGESPDIIECKKYETVTTTSKGCTIANIFSIAAVGISQWIFQ